MDASLNTKNELRAGERILGIDPKSGKNVSVKIGRFGPVAQIGSAEDAEKPRFAQLQKGQSIETITLEEVLELFQLPRTLGQYEGSAVTVGSGRYGSYIAHQKKFVSIPAKMDPFSITLEEAVQLIEEKRQSETDRHIKHFDEQPEMEIVNGRFGPYIIYKGSNYRLSKAQQERAKELTVEECLAIIKEQDEKPKNADKRRYTKRNTAS